MCVYENEYDEKIIHLCLKHELPNIEVAADLCKKAIVPIQRMLEISK